MNLAIFGATGGTGRHLVEQALAAGHHVTVLVRTPAAVTEPHERLHIVQGDVRQVDQVAAVVAGQDAVLSALGPHERGPVDLCTAAMTAILAAMTRHDVRRLVVLSAYGARESHDGGLYNVMLWRIQKEKMLDKERMEELIAHSAVDWTVVRPSALSNGPRTSRYHTGIGLRMRLTSRISRADVAAFMLRQVADTAYLRMSPAIAA
jgi:putative NADH-flavin reductase